MNASTGSRHVWIVMSGSDSEYSIDGVFDSLDAAQEYVDRHDDPRNERRIETWAVNEASQRVVRAGYALLCHELYSPTGSQWKVIDRGWEEWDVSRPHPVDQEPGSESFTVLGKDRDHAYKIAQDRIAEAQERMAERRRARAAGPT